MYVLKTAKGSHLIRKEITSIGRHTTNDIVLENGRISRFHCQIVLLDGRIFLKDCNTINGTYIKNHRILPDRETLLKTGDYFGMGCKAKESVTATIHVKESHETPSFNEENEVVSTTNHAEEDQNMNNVNDNIEHHDDSHSIEEEALAILLVNKPAAVSQNEIREFETRPAQLPTADAEPVSSPSFSHQPERCSNSVPHVKLEPAVCSMYENSNVPPSLPVDLSNSSSCRKSHQVPAYSNFCVKQSQVEDCVEILHNNNVVQHPVVGVSNDSVSCGQQSQSVEGRLSAIHSESMKLVVRQMVEEFFDQKMAATDILPFLLRLNQTAAVSSKGCAGPSNVAPVAIETDSKPVLAELSTAPSSPAANKSKSVPIIKADLDKLETVLKDISPEPILPAIESTKPVLIKMDLSEVNQEEVEVVEVPSAASAATTTPIATNENILATSESVKVILSESVEKLPSSESVAKIPREKRRIRVNLPIETSENVINLCDAPNEPTKPTEDVITISDDEGEDSSRRKQKERKTIDHIVIEDTRDEDVFEDDIISCSNNPCAVKSVSNVEPVFSVKPPVCGSDDLPRESTCAEVSLPESGNDSSFIDLCEDAKPGFVKSEALASSNYSNLEEIIALDSDDEDFPSSQLNTTLIGDVPDFSTTFELMYDDDDHIKEEPQVLQCNENTWFDPFSQGDMVEGKRGSRLRLSSLESDCESGVEQIDVDEKPSSGESACANLVGEENQTTSSEKPADLKTTFNLRSCSVILTDALPLNRRKHKARKVEQKEKRRSSNDFDVFLLGLNDVYKSKHHDREEDKVVRKSPPLSFPSEKLKTRKRKSGSPSMSVQEKKLIKMKRKEKLKEITPKTNWNEAIAKPGARPDAKPVVKVTEKNRGSYLIDTMMNEPTVGKKDKPSKLEVTGSKLNALHTEGHHYLPVHRVRRASSNCDNISNDAKLADQIFSKYCNDDEKPSSSSRRGSVSEELLVDSNAPNNGDTREMKGLDALKNESEAVLKKEIDYVKQVKKDFSSAHCEQTVSKIISTLQVSTRVIKPGKSNLKKPKLLFGPANIFDPLKPKRKVHFHKQADMKTIPFDTMERRNNGIFAPAYKLNESLIRGSVCEFETAVAKVCSWNVKWLEEQQKCLEPPPLYPESDLLAFDCSPVEKYKDELKQLMFSNLWRAIFSSWNKPDNDFLPHTQYICEKTSLSILKIDSVDTTKMEKKLWTIVARRILPPHDTDNDLTNGQIVILNFPVIQVAGGIQKKTMVFGYVASVAKETPANGAHVIQLLCLKIFAKPFQIILGEAKLKVLNYLKTFLRPFQALVMVTRSPLTDLIIGRNRTFFVKPIFDSSGDWFFDKFLDLSQKKAVATCLNCIYSTDPSLCVVNGAAGTGKSQVIVSLMRELFLKNNRSRFPNDLKVLIVTANDVVADDLSYRLEALNKKEKCLNFLRYGNCRGMHAAMKNCTLDKKIQDLLNEDDGNKLINLEEEKNNLRAKIHSIKLVLDSTSAKPEKIKEAVVKLTNNEREWHDMESENSRVIEQLKSQAAKEISIENADVVVTSVFSCWSSNFENDFVPTHYNKGDIHKFTVCIFDDASLINEIGMLIPMMLMVRSLILIGDSKNQIALNKLKSPFYRLLNECSRKAPSAFVALNAQYRSPPHIMVWVDEFYDVKCKPRVIQTPKLQVKSFFVFDVPLSATDDISYRYECQAAYCSMLVEKLNQLEDTNLKFGVIVANPSQKEIIKCSRGLFERGRKVIVDTLEEFSGREQDVVILCLPYHCMQYSSWLYLAVTKAKFSLFVCGDFVYLEPQQPSVRSLAQFARNGNCFSQRDASESDIPNDLILSSSS